VIARLRAAQMAAFESPSQHCERRYFQSDSIAAIIFRNNVAQLIVVFEMK